MYIIKFKERRDASELTSTINDELNDETWVNENDHSYQSVTYWMKCNQYG